MPSNVHYPETTILALRASISHWEENAKAELPGKAHISSDACALCGLFCTEQIIDDEEECVGCPVAERTGEKGCKGSPYSAAVTAWVDWDNAERFGEGEERSAAYIATLRDAWRVAARAEVEFLKGLERRKEP